MKTNCTCSEKTEEWEYDSSIGYWYATRECSICEYYWEGPDYSKSNRYMHPTMDKTQNGDYSSPKDEETAQSPDGAFHIYCYDQLGRYGAPVKLSEVQDIFNFCEINKHSHFAIRVIDPKEDAMVIEVIKGKYVFPEQWARFNSN